MRIGITGASGTGKTTLTQALSRHLHLPTVIEGAREAAEQICIQSAREINESNALAFQRLVLRIKMKEEQRFPEGFVSDRTIVDCAAFWLYRELKGFLPDIAPQRDRYFNQIEAKLKGGHYDLIVHLESGSLPWQDDGFRTYDSETMDALIVGVLYGRFRRSLEVGKTAVVICPKEITELASRVSFVEQEVANLGVGVVKEQGQRREV